MSLLSKMKSLTFSMSSASHDSKNDVVRTEDAQRDDFHAEPSGKIGDLRRTLVHHLTSLLTTRDDIRALVSSVDQPVNVLAMPGTPSVDELASIGVARVSVGGAFAFAALAGLIDAATELRDHGTYSYWQRVAGARQTIRDAFKP